MRQERRPCYLCGRNRLPDDHAPVLVSDRNQPPITIDACIDNEQCARRCHANAVRRDIQKKGSA